MKSFNDKFRDKYSHQKIRAIKKKLYRHFWKIELDFARQNGPPTSNIPHLAQAHVAPLINGNRSTGVRKYGSKDTCPRCGNMPAHAPLLKCNTDTHIVFNSESYLFHLIIIWFDSNVAMQFQFIRAFYWLTLAINHVAMQGELFTWPRRWWAVEVPGTNRPVSPVPCAISGSNRRPCANVKEKSTAKVLLLLLGQFFFFFWLYFDKTVRF